MQTTGNLFPIQDVFASDYTRSNLLLEPGDRE